MALAIDGSTPAKVTGTTAAITTGAFSPPANSLLVAFTARNGPASNNDDGTVSSTGGLSWNLAGRKSTNASSTDGAGTEACAEIWWAYASSAPGSITVTDTRADAATGSDRQHILQVEVITGSETTWGGAIHGTSSTSGLPSASVTTTNSNSWVFAAASDWAAAGLGTPGTGQTMIAEDNVVGQYSAHIWRQTSTTAVSGTSVTMNLTAPSAEQYNELAIEIREPAATDAGGFIQSGFHPGRGPTNARFYQPPRSLDVIAAATPITLTDTGTADDSGFTVSATVPLTDAGSAADALTVAATVPLSDTGSAADAIAVTAAVPLTDSGTAADSVAVTAAVPLSDTGSAADSLAVTASVPLSDSGSGAETAAVAATVPLTDTGSAADSITVNTGSNPALPDSGSASDALTVVVTTPLTDSGSALEALTAAVALALTDAGSAADVLVAVSGLTNQPGTLTPSTTSGRVGANTASPRQNPATAGARAGASSAAASLNPSTSGGHA